MSRFHGNLTDEIWQQLKGWARVHARSSAPATTRLCTTRVSQIVKELTGRSDTLPAQVIEFYANEALAMVNHFREAKTEPAGFETAI